jgi:hypothetical protein
MSDENYEFTEEEEEIAR